MDFFSNSLIDSNNSISSDLPLEIMRKSMENKNLLSEKNSLYVGTGDSTQISVNGANYTIVQTGVLSPPDSTSSTVLLSSNNPSSGISVGWGVPTLSQINQDNTPMKVSVDGILSAMEIDASQAQTLKNFLQLISINGNNIIFDADIKANEVLLNEST